HFYGNTFASCQFVATKSKFFISKSGIAQSKPEGILNGIIRLIVVHPYHLGLLLRRLVVICNQGIGIHRIGIRQFPAWVLISKKYISYGLSTKVAWKVSLHHTFHQWLDGSDYTRT